MTLNAALKKIREIAEARGGVVSKTGRFVDLPNDPDVVGWGIVTNAKGDYLVVAIPQ